jgi:hypothetical protein
MVCPAQPARGHPRFGLRLPIAPRADGLGKLGLGCGLGLMAVRATRGTMWVVFAHPAGVWIRRRSRNERMWHSFLFHLLADGCEPRHVARLYGFPLATAATVATKGACRHHRQIAFQRRPQP